MKYLGIDYGIRRIGIAVSDEEGRIAFPRAALHHRGTEAVMRKLEKLVRSEKIEEVVIGMPIALDGQETQQSRVTRRFLECLRKHILLPVHEVDERFTTRMARAAGVEKKHQDASAAALILQGYLDCMRAHQ